jgi:uncharacterized membrane protein
MADEFDDFDDAPSRGRVEPHRGAVILVLGILGLLVCGFIGIAAWVMGKSDLEKMRRGQMDREGEGLTKAGYILGLVSVILMAVGVVIGCLAFGFGMFAAGAKR